MNLCEAYEPSAELVAKYDSMKSTFFKRIVNLYNKVHAAVLPLVETAAQGERGQAARDYVENLQTKPEFQAFVKVATWVLTQNLQNINKYHKILSRWWARKRHLVCTFVKKSCLLGFVQWCGPGGSSPRGQGSLRIAGCIWTPSAPQDRQGTEWHHRQNQGLPGQILALWVKKTNYITCQQPVIHDRS